MQLDIDGSSGDINLEREMAENLQQLFDLFKVKQRSYGADNIAIGGYVGVNLRMSDKMRRMWNLVVNGIANPLVDESEEDTLLDLADYALIALLVKRGIWPLYEPPPAQLALERLAVIMQSGTPEERAVLDEVVALLRERNIL
jgi:hypothetical protein